MSHFNCPICSSSKNTRINTYKHFWISCDGCSNIFRDPKVIIYSNPFFAQCTEDSKNFMARTHYHKHENATADRLVF